MKKYKAITVITIILVIGLITTISFFGIYRQKEYKVVDVLPRYLLGMEFTGGINVNFEVDNSVNNVIYDKEGNLVEDEDEEYTEENGYTTVEEKVNEDEALTEQNYKRTKEILQKRLKDARAKQYEIRQDNNTGKISVTIPDNEEANFIISNIVQNGKIEIQDSETKEVLMDNNDISKSTVVYGQEQTGTGTSVYLQLKFNKEGAKKLEEISKIYIKTETEDETEESEEGSTEETKQISIMYDDSALTTTYFGETMTDGILNIFIGTGTTAEEIRAYMEEGSTIATALNIGKMPIIYNTTGEEFTSTINETTVKNSIYVVVAIVAISMFILVIIFKLKGIYSIILQAGYIGSLLIVLRLTNVIITLEGIFAILITIAINYIVMYTLLNNIVKNKMKVNEAIKEVAKKTAIMLMPIYIIAVIFTFASFANISSFGMVLVWGIILFYMYNLVLTRTLFKVIEKEA